MQEEWLNVVSHRLSDAGYERVDEELDGPFGNILIRFKGEECEVITGREKLQWYIGIAPRGGRPVMMPHVWAIYLDGVEPDVRDAERLEWQLEFIYSRLTEVEEVAARDSGVGDKLRAINRKLVMDRLRLGPDMKRRKND
ncbi:hypothetical protein ACIHIX_24280 [Streptomyces sp. NPDC051913]|uniref:hypothetical protein n=1 Tax=Streptomyces sp. NPDC051913 TaxID=3365676 RepID=UPI0037D98357